MRVPRLLPETPTPERCVETYYLQRTRFESIADVEISGRDLDWCNKRSLDFQRPKSGFDPSAVALLPGNFGRRASLRSLHFEAVARSQW